MNRAFSAVDFFAIQKNPITIASYSRIEPQLLMMMMMSRKLKRATFDAHVAAPHGMAADNAGVGDNPAPAGKTEVLSQVIFLRRRFGKTFHALHNFHQALLALPLFAARSWNTYAKRLRVFEE
jgi:hypothetical protein